jgi:protein-tyrosine phosphatase
MTIQPNQRHLKLQGAYNIRDLGGYAVADGGATQWGRLLRSDGLHRLTAVEAQLLADRGLATVIDLRRGGELQEAPNPFARFDGVAYHHVSLFDKLAPLELVGSANLLYDLYCMALRERGPAFAEVLRLIADAPDGIVLFHCTAGKDRTGLIAAMLLLIAGVDDETILADYAMTGPLIEPLLEELIHHASARGIDVAAFRPLLACEPATMAATLVELESAHGGVQPYLASIGIGADIVRRLRDRLTALMPRMAD